MTNKYILSNKIPILIEADNPNALSEWAEWFDSYDRTVKKTKLTDDIRVSTVFLGMDHGDLDGSPLLFETMVFCDGSGCAMGHCSTWEQAEVMHDVTVKQIKTITWRRFMRRFTAFSLGFLVGSSIVFLLIQFV